MTSSSETSSNQAVPVAVPFRPRCRRTRSFAVVATKSVSTFPKGRVAPEAGEWFVKGTRPSSAPQRPASGSGPSDPTRLLRLHERRQPVDVPDLEPDLGRGNGDRRRERGGGGGSRHPRARPRRRARRRIRPERAVDAPGSGEGPEPSSKPPFGRPAAQRRQEEQPESQKTAVRSCANPIGRTFTVPPPKPGSRDRTVPGRPGTRWPFHRTTVRPRSFLRNRPNFFKRDVAAANSRL